MLTRYIQAAMRKARYEILPDDGSFYGNIPGFDGVWANAPTLEACREELEEVLEDWIVLGLSKQLPLPVVKGIELTVKRSRLRQMDSTRPTRAGGALPRPARGTGYQCSRRRGHIRRADP